MSAKYAAFLPAFIAPPLITLCAVYAYTRLLSPAEYGIYALALSVVQLGLSILFSWLQLSVKRFYPHAKEQGEAGQLAVSVYAAYGLCAVIAAIGFAVLIKNQAEPALRLAYSFGFGLLLIRSLATISKSFQLAQLNAKAFGAMEGGESLIGFVAALLVIKSFSIGGAGIILGLTIGAMIPVIVDSRNWRERFSGGHWSLATARAMFRFGAPITYGYGLEYVMSSSDRFMIQHFLSESAVGVYSVSYALAERGISVVFQALASVAYSLVMTAFETGGAEKAREQARGNCELMLVLSLPAWIGFLAIVPQMAVILTGPSYAAEAVRLMPWIASAVFISCWRLHYFDHAFHLARRTDFYIYTAGPPAALNVALNIWLLPIMGIMGAAIATLAAYGLALFISLILGRRLFRLPFPWPTAGKAGAASVIMGLLIKLFDAPPTVLGLTSSILVGATVYALLALAVDLANCRQRLLGSLRGF